MGAYLTSGSRFRSEPLAPASRALLWALLVLAVAVLVAETGHTPFFEPDEARYAEIPREMLATGDLVAPRLNGFRYYEKPPLHYWAVAASMSLFGESELSARLPAKLSAAGMVLVTVLFARRRYGERVALVHHSDWGRTHVRGCIVVVSGLRGDGLEGFARYAGGGQLAERLPVAY